VPRGSHRQRFTELSCGTGCRIAANWNKRRRNGRLVSGAARLLMIDADAEAGYEDARAQRFESRGASAP
jgi:hypothetical protein